MDWIQIYFIAMLSLSALLHAHQHGKPRDNESFLNFVVSLIVALPYIGRLMNWW